jgi:hypothetical protein
MDICFLHQKRLAAVKICSSYDCPGQSLEKADKIRIVEAPPAEADDGDFIPGGVLDIGTVKQVRRRN